MTPLNSI